ncbi:MAG: hypothetical protein JSR45_13965 [Proteobacteria bacterium]|nr:hypothetical protein [Pseudomonadota bacterium]
MERPADNTDIELISEFAARSEATVKHLAAWQALIPPEQRNDWWADLRQLAEEHARKSQN